MTFDKESTMKERTGALRYAQPDASAGEHAEGPVARGIEQQTAKLPSDVFLWAALGSMAGSLFLLTAGKREVANFVGQWVPTILILGVYNKIVKQLGSDRATA
jgi:hypothetical protein